MCRLTLESTLMPHPTPWVALLLERCLEIPESLSIRPAGTRESKEDSPCCPPIWSLSQHCFLLVSLGWHVGEDKGQSPRVLSLVATYMLGRMDGHTTSCGVFLVSHERQCLSPASSHMACLRLPDYDTNLQLLLGPLAFEATGRNVRPD